MNVRLHNAKPRDFPVVMNLVPYYVYDMSEHMGWPCKTDGRFDSCDHLPTYWTEKNKHAFVLRAGKELAGFAMVRGDHEEPQIDYSIAEFFVLRKFRRRGVGEVIARQLFDRFLGRWKVDYLSDNKPAAKFWPRVIARYTKKDFKKHSGKSGYGNVTILLFRNGI